MDWDRPNKERCSQCRRRRTKAKCKGCGKAVCYMCGGTDKINDPRLCNRCKETGRMLTELAGVTVLDKPPARPPGWRP